MNLLQRPYYFEENLHKRWGIVCSISLFIFLFLWGFQPFQINSYPGNILQLVLGYTAVTFAVTTCFYILFPMLFSRFFDAEHWTTGKAIFHSLVMLLCIGFFNLVYSSQIGILHFSLRGLLYFESYTFAVGIFPIGFLVLFNERRKYAQHHALSDEIMESKPELISTTSLPETILALEASNGKIALELLPNTIYYIKSEANYVEVFYLEKENLQKGLIRNTLTAMENQLEAHPDFFRCHKSYIVNMNCVEHISGNAQGLKIHFSEIENIVPVSRKNNEILKKRLTLRP